LNGVKLVSVPEASRILVVDDEPTIVSFVDRVLRDAGYVTTLAGGGPQALEAAAKADKFHLLLTDVAMPEMSGDELARRLRRDDPHLKVLYLTGYSDRLFQEKITLWEDEAFLEKPCSMRGLLEAVSLLIHGGIKRTAVAPVVPPLENSLS
jgi:two-component system cell cycle sensor histidine kinase/response regulator CckA